MLYVSASWRYGMEHRRSQDSGARMIAQRISREVSWERESAVLSYSGKVRLRNSVTPGHCDAAHGLPGRQRLSDTRIQMSRRSYEFQPGLRLRPSVVIHDQRHS